MQNVILEIDSPFLEHRRCWLRNEQIFQVGASDLMDLGIPGDRYMNEHHFSIQVLDGQCAILDQGTVNGTWVNGKRIECIWLGDGDQIQAGESMFRVRILGQKPRSSAAFIPVGHQKTTSLLADPDWCWKANELSAGTFLCQPAKSADYTFTELMNQLKSVLPIYAIVDRQELGWNSDITHAYLNESSELMPFVTLYPLRNNDQFLERAMGLCDQANSILVGSHLPFPQLQRLLQRNATSFSSATLFESQLRHAPAPFAKSLLTDIESLIWSDGNSGWKMAIHADPNVHWQRLSLPRAPQRVTPLVGEDDGERRENTTFSSLMGLEPSH